MPVAGDLISSAMSRRVGSAAASMSALSKSKSTSPIMAMVTASLPCRTDTPSWRAASAPTWALRSDMPPSVSDGKPFRSRMVACKPSIVLL
ncbi:Uncharacterised protein [Bordetella pertussis]|nr:Uncharacterised protein [Bordetella pertussis]